MKTASAFSFSRVSVDNRPKRLLVTCLESNGQQKNQIVNFINSLGCQIENVIDYQIQQGENSSNISGIEDASAAGKSTSSKSFVICFLTRKDAEVVRIIFQLIYSFLNNLFALKLFNPIFEADFCDILL